MILGIFSLKQHANQLGVFVLKLKNRFKIYSWLKFFLFGRRQNKRSFEIRQQKERGAGVFRLPSLKALWRWKNDEDKAVRESLFNFALAGIFVCFSWKSLSCFRLNWISQNLKVILATIKGALLFFLENEDFFRKNFIPQVLIKVGNFI